MKHMPMMMLTVLLFLMAIGKQNAQDLANLYDKAALSYDQPRFQQRLDATREVFWQQLTPEEKANLLGTRLECPLIGQNRYPLDYYSNSKAGIVTMPILSLKFFEDLCVAYAWLYVNQYRLETIEEYVTMLRFKRAADFSTHRYPPPLEALQIPKNALEDKKVDDLSLRLRNEGWAFILGHELGHILKRHYFYHGGSPEEAKRNAQANRKNEEEADAFAIELMRRTTTIPMGAILFFQASAYYFFPDPRELSEKEWRNSPDELADHPISAHRLQAIATQLNDGAGSFARNEKTVQGEQNTISVIHFIAQNLALIAQALEDPDLYRLMAARAKTADISSLAPRRHAEEAPGQ
jgi:hypothetical protein